jgi:hypothetical protein
MEDVIPAVFVFFVAMILGGLIGIEVTQTSMTKNALIIQGEKILIDYKVYECKKTQELDLK